VIAATGEDALVYCPTSDYAANMEAAEALPVNSSRAAATGAGKDRHARQVQVRGRG
jgi:prolyl-tRNA synthetase